MSTRIPAANSPSSYSISFELSLFVYPSCCFPISVPLWCVCFFLFSVLFLRLRLPWFPSSPSFKPMRPTNTASQDVGSSRRAGATRYGHPALTDSYGRTRAPGATAPFRPQNTSSMLPLITPKRYAPRGGKTAAGISSDPNEGFMQLLEKGKLPRDYDLEPALTSDGPMRALPVTLHATQKDRRRPQQILTQTSGFHPSMNAFKLDYSEIEKLPAKMNVAELKEWEVVEARERARRVVAGGAADSFSSLPSDEMASTALPGDEEISREDPRTYAELLDLYSMHEFIIRKGRTLRNTPEFASFKRHYVASWGNIETLIDILEEFLGSYGIEIAYIDGKRVAALSACDPGSLLSRQDLVDCIANKEDVEPLIDDVGQQFHYGNQGHHIAAAKIQATWRMYRQRIAYMHLLVGTRAAVIIQRQWAIHRAHCVTRRAIHTVRETRLARWRQTMERFTQRWPTIREERRTVIHLPSLSIPSFHAGNVPFYFARQFGQLTRLADLRDPLVDLVVIAPFKPEPEVMDYYNSLLGEAGVANASGRMTLLVPEDVKRLPEGMSLTRYVLLSARLMKLLRAFCTGKPAFIVPGYIGPEELTLASLLNVPMLAPEPRIAQVFGTKSGCQRLLESADVLTPPGATQLRSRTDLLRALATLMTEHREVSRWLVKLETESGSRGHAYFDSSRIKALKEDEHGTSFTPPLGPGAAAVPLVDRVLAELEEFGPRRVRLVHTSSYPDWLAYLAMVDQVGACIEAVPNKVVANATANLFIEPTGEVRLQSVVEPMLAPAYTEVGCCYPHLLAHIPYEAVRDAALSVGAAAFRKRIIGYMSVDFVVLERSDVTQTSLQLWGVDVDLRLTDNAAAHRFSEMLTASSFDSDTGTTICGPSGLPLHYVYSGLIYNPFIAAIKHTSFFSLCRSRRLAFDASTGCGVVFHLVDVLLRSCLGTLSLGTDVVKVVRSISDFQSLLNSELPKQGEHASGSNFVYFSAVVRQLSRSVKTIQTQPH